MDSAMHDLLSVVNWSRAQFAMTAIYHWLFVPLTLGLGFLCAIMETIYYRTGKEEWKRIARFWMTLFGINFGIGVATGIILEFEFGTNWSNYSHFVGDIFGAPLAIEGMMAFFMEATFLAVMFFGWDRVSKRFHLISTWLTAIGANLSALWILVANAWMQYPVGTTFNIETTRCEMTSFWEVLFSPVAMTKFPHTVTSGFVLASVFVVSISAWYLLRKRETDLALKSIRIAALFGLFGSIAVCWTGDLSTVQVARVQPVKLAAMEALYDGQQGAPLSVFALVTQDDVRLNLEIPKMLSILSFHDADAYVAGLNDLMYGNPEQGLLSVDEKIIRGRVAIEELSRFHSARATGDSVTVAAITRKFDPQTNEGALFLTDYFRYFGYGYLQGAEDIKPNVPLLYYSFRVMVGLGLFFIVLFILILVSQRKGTLAKNRTLLKLMLYSLPLPYIATIAGWCVTEVGRQPWTVQDLLPTIASVSRNDTASVMVTFFIFVALFTTLLIAEIRIMLKQIKLGSEHKH